jgi:transposase
MLDNQTLQKLGGWEGYRLKKAVWPSIPGGTLELHLEPTRKWMTCEGCGQRSRRVHETATRRVRDLPLFEHRVVLIVPRRRLWCDKCDGPQLEQLSWLGRYQRVTNRLADACNQLLRATTVQTVATFYGLGWHTVKALDKRHLQASVAEPDWASIEYLAMDEFALHKGHRYATVVVEPIRRQVLWLGEGRSRETAHRFFEQLPEGTCEQIRAVAIDMTTAYELEIKAHCPNAEVVYDLFHVVAKYGREVIDRVRVDEANRLRSQRQDRKVIKSSRWLLLRNRSALNDSQTIKLKEILDANQSLMTAYVLRDELRRLWFYRRRGSARKAWQQWYEQAMDSGIEALKRFAERLKPYLPGIIARCDHPLNTSIVEGINNSIKVIKRRAYGYRDQEYFFLKVRAAFPGIPR